MIALINYGAGNTFSVSNVLNDLNVDFCLTSDKAVIRQADRIILPGVGEASSAMKKLDDAGIAEDLRITKVPLLGICLGMQLLCNSTSEGNANCLGVIPERAEKFKPGNLKVPHMGWNRVAEFNGNRIFFSVNENEYFYFAHSYYLPLNKFTTSVCDYGNFFSASVRYKNFIGVQFHPEKSGPAGIQVVKNFLEIC